MKQVKVFYSKINNMGDLLNELIIEKVLGYKVIHCSRFECQTSGIGSSLNLFFSAKSKLPSMPKRLIQTLYSKMQPPLQIWSTGFINYSSEDHVSIRKENHIASVRGELTRLRLEKILNKELNIPTGDGGLLASYLLKPPLRKKYSVGIIPHFKEKDELRFKKLQENYKDSVFIDLTDAPLSVVETMSQCEVILSSSLHGLIVADSFGIPNKRLVYTDKLLGDGYKFDDYYSAFKISSKVFDLNKPGYPKVNNIIDDYKITVPMVEQKKKDLIASFSKYL
ncbi:polysaccharide pyruvyl transferase family protein [Cohnella pontilimi]|uniref:Polysaccharide pyruvyl transferase family protein n=1 Tax=Cohnella pontilimi TaxID=2564100 RepID=A0A4U0FEK8_9BACL|nr:polysaccharide pyruvyl transferase family protein [Cohnella pontilimi]TJY42754.1 polysaccharide pyruvyl transferase family protein [Cohnella pontilimi]